MSKLWIVCKSPNGKILPPGNNSFRPKAIAFAMKSGMIVENVTNGAETIAEQYA